MQRNQGVDILNIDDLFKDEDDSPASEPSSTEKPEGELTQNMINRINTVKQNTEKRNSRKDCKRTWL